MLESSFAIFVVLAGESVCEEYWAASDTVRSPCELVRGGSRPAKVGDGDRSDGGAAESRSWAILLAVTDLRVHMPASSPARSVAAHPPRPMLAPLGAAVELLWPYPRAG